MPLLESAEQRRPVFDHPEGEAPHAVKLSIPEKLDHLTSLPPFIDMLDEPFEKRPMVTEDGQRQTFDLSVRDALLEHAEFYIVSAGTTIFREGSFGEHLFLILAGHVQTSTHISIDDKNYEVQLEELQTDDFFGEMSALSMNAHLLKAEATATTFLLLIPQFIVKELATTQERFRQVIMQSYVQRAMQVLIRRVPMLRFSTNDEIDRLLPRVELKTFEAGEIIFEEGDPADDLYVVHQGFVKIAKQQEQQQRILTYLVEGDCFGETGILMDQARSASATAMSRTELLVIPGADFCRLVRANPRAEKEAEGLVHLRQLNTDMVESVTFIGLRVERQAEIMPNLDVLAIDESICVRCDNCVTACAAAHEDGISRLIRKGTIFEETLLPTACRFCQDPVCLLCKSGGIKRDKDGDIYFTDSCIGCSGCAQRCPYGNIIMIDTEEMEQLSRPRLAQRLLRKVLPKRRSSQPQQRPRLKTIPVKCDLDKDHLFPACVNNCPTQAIRRYRAEELDFVIAEQTRSEA